MNLKLEGLGIERSFKMNRKKGNRNCKPKLMQRRRTKPKSQTTSTQNQTFCSAKKKKNEIAEHDWIQGVRISTKKE
jgi:hypothetical protein